MAEGSAGRILVVDDSPTVREVLTEVLTASGYEVTTAGDGIEGLSAFYAHPPDLLLLDLEMPRMEGYQVCRFIKGDSRVADVPVAILTSHDAQSERFRGLAVGAEAYLVKRLDDRTFQEVVAQLVARSPWRVRPVPSLPAITEAEVLQQLNRMLDHRLFISSVVNELNGLNREVGSLSLTLAKFLELFGRLFDFVVGGVILAGDPEPHSVLAVRHGYKPELREKFREALGDAARGAGLEVPSRFRPSVLELTSALSRSFPDKAELEALEFWRLTARGTTIGILGLGATAAVKLDQAGSELLREVVAHASVILDNARLVNALAATNADLAAALQEVKSAQLQLIHSEKMASLGQMTAGLVHEMNNPMTFIAGNVDHLADYARKLLAALDACMRGAEVPVELELDFIREDLPSLLQDMREGVTRAQNIIADLRTFSAGDRAGTEPTNLSTVVDSALNIIRFRWEKKIQMVKDYADIPEVDCNASQIGQVVMNLVTNAIDAVAAKGDQGVVRVGIRAQGESAVLEVSDNGAGITSDVMARLFEPFFTTKEVGAGMGLGLAVTHSIVARHGGRIDVKSEPGSGTTFRVYLPFRRGREGETEGQV